LDFLLPARVEDANLNRQGLAALLFFWFGRLRGRGLTALLLLPRL